MGAGAKCYALLGMQLWLAFPASAATEIVIEATVAIPNAAADDDDIPSSLWAWETEESKPGR